MSSSVVFDVRHRFVLDLAAALHRRGAAAHRLEDVIEAVATALRLRAHVLCTPTSVQVAFDRPDGQHTCMVRVRPSEIDLGKLARIGRLIAGVESGQLRVAVARERLHAIESARTAPGLGGTALAGGVTSGAAAIFFGGGIGDLLAAAALGGGIVLLAGWLGRSRDAARVYEPLAAFVASFGAWMLASRFALAPEVVSLSALIMLVPGLGITVAVTELASGHVVSGSARLAGAGALFISIAFGVALGQAAAGTLVGPVSVGSVGGAPPAVWAVALVVAPISFVPLFHAERRDGPWIWCAGLVGFGGSSLGAHMLGPELGVFVGALALGTFGNLYARWTGRPASVLRIPGLLLLVPGSTGFRSLASFMAEDPVAGAEGAFRVGLVAMGLVAGLFAANLVVPPRRPL
jgi:uncharacterized membrane protein YjjP (DUF1212 family)